MKKKKTEKRKKKKKKREPRESKRVMAAAATAEFFGHLKRWSVGFEADCSALRQQLDYGLRRGEKKEQPIQMEGRKGRKEGEHVSDV